MGRNQILRSNGAWVAFPALLMWTLATLTTGCGGGSKSSPSPTPSPNRAVKVFSVTPSTVSSTGGQNVTIAGEGFIGRANVQLRFPGGLTDARVVSDTVITGTTVPTNFSSNPFTDEIIIIADGISSKDHSPSPVMVSVKK